PKRAEARSIGQRRWELELVLTEGRTREVRRLCEALGLDVERLVRTRYGPIELGRLPAGEVRVLSAKEKLALRAATRIHLMDEKDADEPRQRPTRGARRGGSAGSSGRGGS